MSGRFITLEGGEGVGKSTLAAALLARLEAAGRRVDMTREPGGTPLAEAVRDLALHPPGSTNWSPLALALLMNAARLDHLERRIRPALASGRVVVCDRFADSTRVYQSVQDGAAPAALDALEQWVVGETQPDLSLLLDADPEAVLGRRAERAGPHDAFEARDLTFHRAIREGFLSLAARFPERIVVLDASRPASEVAANAWAVVSERLGL